MLFVPDPLASPDPARAAGNVQMNSMIFGALRSGRISTGGASRLAGDAQSRQERMRTLLAERESAAGDEDALAFVEHKIDRLTEEARAQPRDPETGQYVSFDGGVQGRRPLAPGGGPRVESSTQLLRQAMLASHFERAEREARGPIVIP